jgi:hypothetical protein
MEEETKTESVFNDKYNEFVDDLMGALPEYTDSILVSKALDKETRLKRFQEEVKDCINSNTELNPGMVLPDVCISDAVWNTLSDVTKNAIWEHMKILSICCFMETGFNGNQQTPEWMNEAMEDMQDKLKNVDFQSIISKFMKFFSGSSASASASSASSASASSAKEDSSASFGGIPNLPPKFMNSQLAKLAQEIIKDITPEDLGVSPEIIEECEKDPSRSFAILLSVFTNNPDIIKKTIAKIGNRLQKKIQSGAIRPQEIAKEAEELMKEFSGNSSFVDMMQGMKDAFGMDGMDMDFGKKPQQHDSNSRLNMARERLRKKLDKKKQGQSKK